MEDTILVTYASRNGATREIAEKIGAALRQANLAVDVLPVDGVHNLEPYRAVGWQFLNETRGKPGKRK